jgi:hypothetical protein
MHPNQKERQMSQRTPLSNVKNVYFQTAPFVSGMQPKKVDSASGFEFALTDHALELRRGNQVSLIPYANIVSIAYEEIPLPIKGSASYSGV